MAEVVEFVLEPWRSGLGQRALLEVVLLASFGGALAFWVVAFGLAYGAESFAHGLLPGLVAAALIGVPLVLGALAGAIAAGALVGVAARDQRVGTDTATAVVVTGLLGAGGMLALLPSVPQRLGEILFGSPVSARPFDLAAAAALLVLGSMALAVLHRPLVALAFDPEGAGSLGPRRGRVFTALLVLVALAICVAAQGLGNLLVLALLVAPAVAVRRFTTSPLAAMLSGSAVASCCGLLGLYASFHLELAAGASVALMLCVAAAAGAMLPRRRARRG